MHSEPVSRFTHSKSQLQRQILHPLQVYEPKAATAIQFLKLEYLEAETTKPPVPRNQDVPEDAFCTLSGRSILVATSHAWYFQYHPDPHGVKLNILRKNFFPRLRKRYPRTNILIFDDWHSCPQWPRITQEENNRFNECMNHMNSVYRYCDVVLLVEAPLPELDNTVFSCYLVPSQHKWLNFIDTIQYLEGKEEKVPVRKNDIVVGIGNIKKSLTIDYLKHEKEKTIIYFLKRPFGRPNRTPSKKRGWLFAERFTTAIKAAMSKPERFQDMIMTNVSTLRTEIYMWSLTLRAANKSGTASLKQALDSFEKMLNNKHFTSEGDSSLVRRLIHESIHRLGTSWDEEVERQNQMSKRAREILLRWGCFSEDYVERAELLCDSNNCTNDKRSSWILLSIIVVVIVPMVAILPYVFSLEVNGEDPSREGLVVSSVWLGCNLGYVILCFVCCAQKIVLLTYIYRSLAVIVLHATNLAFAKIPIGIHTVCACVAAAAINALTSFVLRTSLSTIVPFEALFSSILGLILMEVICGMIKFIPVKDQETGQTNRWAIGTIILTRTHTHITLSLHITYQELMTPYNQELGFTCQHHIDSISKHELL
jgi:hypothetical protein